MREAVWCSISAACLLRVFLQYFTIPFVPDVVLCDRVHKTLADQTNHDTQVFVHVGEHPLGRGENSSEDQYELREHGHLRQTAAGVLGYLDQLFSVVEMERVAEDLLPVLEEFIKRLVRLRIKRCTHLKQGRRALVRARLKWGGAGGSGERGQGGAERGGGERGCGERGRGERDGGERDGGERGGGERGG